MSGPLNCWWNYLVNRSFVAGEWSPDGTRFVTGWTDGVIQINDARTFEELFSFDAHPDGRIDLARWSPDSQRIASTNHYGDIKLWDAANGDLLLDLNPEDSSYKPCCDWSGQQTESSWRPTDWMVSSPSGTPAQVTSGKR